MRFPPDYTCVYCNVGAKQTTSRKVKSKRVTKSKTAPKSKTVKTASPSTPRAKTKRKKRKPKKDASKAVERCRGILCPAAMDNLYYIAHSAADALRLRGFRWPKSKRRKKGKAKKKR